MAVNLNSDYSFHEMPSGDISIRQGSHKTDIRIKALDPSSPETKEKIQKGAAIIITLSSSEQIPIEKKELKQAIKKLTSKSPEVNKALKNLSPSTDVPSLLSGAKAVSIDWKQHIKEIKSLSPAKQIQAALEMDDTLRKGIDGLKKNSSDEATIHRLSGYREKAKKLLNAGIEGYEKEAAADASPSRSVETMNILRQMQSYNQLEGSQLSKIIKLTQNQLPKHIPKAAAQKGEALRRATDEMVALVRRATPLKPLGTSNQDVFLGSNIVFKRTVNNLASEEEKLADGLGQIFDPDTYVPQASIQNLDADSLGIAVLTPDEQKRAIALKDYTHPDDPRGRIVGNGLSQPAAQSLFDKNSWKAFIHDTKGNQPKLGQVYLDLETGFSAKNSARAKAVYDRVSQRTWNVKDPYTDEIVAIKSPVELIFAITAGLEFSVQDEDKLNPEESNQIEEDLAILTVLMSGSLRYVPANLSWTTPARPGAQVTVKPKVEHMLLLNDLEKKKISGTVLSRVTDPKQQVKAVRALYVQPLDLHGKNIGLHPALTPELQKYENARFSYGQTKDVDIYKLQIDFLTKAVGENAKVTITLADGTEVKRSLKEFPELIHAVSGNWELDFFDTDFNFAETNGLLSYREENAVVSPVRNFLIGTPFANMPLSDEAIDQFMEDSSKVDQALHYLKNDHHPLLQRMKPEQRTDLRQELDAKLAAYTLGNDLIKDSSNLNQFKHAFATDLSQQPQLPLWDQIDTTMRSYSVPYGSQMTLEQLAHEQHVDVNELLASNAALDSILDPLVPGTSIVLPPHYVVSDPATSLKSIAESKKIPLSLLIASNSIPSALAHQPLDIGTTVNLPTIRSPQMEAKRYELAVQLFPKATIAQQKAFLERLDRQDTYLSTFKTLQGIDGQEVDPQEFYDVLLFSSESIAIPLTSFQRNILNELLKAVDLKGGTAKQELQVIRSMLLDWIKPTMANMVKCHYPITSDIIDLTEQVWGRQDLPDFSLSVGQLLADARKRGHTEASSPAYAAVKRAFDKV